MRTIGKYIVQGLLGRGGMSVVYKALLPVVDKVVALKAMSPHPTLLDLWGEESIRRRFTAEAAIMGSMRHPHVVEILDFDFALGRPFFTMEHHPRSVGELLGEGLRMEAECRILPVDHAIRYARELLVGLGRLHRAGLIHRDIKPHNLLIDDEGRLKISDLGLSKLRGETSEGAPPNLVLGSPFYAAPEQVSDAEGVDFRADIYSAGVVIHRMITGRFPEDMSGAPSQMHPDAESVWDAFLSRAVHREPDGRFSGTEEMLDALEGLTDSWRDTRARFCEQFASRVSRREQVTAEESPRPRSIPLKVTPGKAPEIFGCDRLWRPRRFSDSLSFQEKASGSLYDPVSGLTWQGSGSTDPVNWREARAYVKRLNRDAFAGIDTWRLPTVDELFSSLDPPVLNASRCADHHFDRTKTCVWSSDRRSYGSAWYVDVELGFAAWGDFSSRFFVRAVSGPRAEREDPAWEDRLRSSGDAGCSAMVDEDHQTSRFLT
jgi:serine/threonine-protein kinase